MSRRLMGMDRDEWGLIGNRYKVQPNVAGMTMKSAMRLYVHRIPASPPRPPQIHTLDEGRENIRPESGILTSR